MRQPLAQPLTLDFDQVWLMKTERGRALLDVLSSGDVAALLAKKVDQTDGRLADSRPPTVHGKSLHDSTVCPSDDPRLTDARTPLVHGMAQHSADVSFGFCPIGSIVGWHKDLTGTPALPSGWVECNAQVVDDPASPYFGVAVPGLNSGYFKFLRGTAGSATGSMGGSISHSHTVPNGHVHPVDLSVNLQTVSGADNDISVPFPSTFTSGPGTPAESTDDVNHEPQFMEVVWIIRIK